jgi:tyrosinase
MAEPFIRREVRELPPGDETLQAYARAVAVMKEREPTDPRSWSYQAAMHGSTVTPPHNLWNGCKHASWFFLAWHRMYVYFFEQIVREIVVETGGPEDWALPYWNYCKGGENATLPEAFRNPDDENGAPNPLYVEEREKGINSGQKKLSNLAISPTKALERPQFIGKAEFGGGIAPAQPQFAKFTGRIEQTPHNDVHNELGGWMQDPFTAAQDPIFWLHHTNIDRLWVEWNATPGHLDPQEAQWMGQKFEFFNAEGQLTGLACAQVVDTVEDLDYRYDPEPAAQAAPAPLSPPPPSQPKVVGANAEGVTLVGDSTGVTVGIDPRASDDVLAATGESDPRRLYVNIEEIEGEVNPGSVYAVYVNLPADAGESTREAHYVGNVSFFGIERAPKPSDDEHGHSLNLSYEIGEQLRKLNDGKDWGGEQIKLSFEPLGLEPAEGVSGEAAVAELAEQPAEDPPVQIGRVSLVVE